jgi:PAS domain S-box-containing protein
MTARVALALWTLALAVAAGAVALIFTSDHESSPWVPAVLSTAVGLAFVGAGLIAAVRRPDNLTGALMTLTGFTWFLGALTAANNDGVFTAGVALSEVTLGFLAWVILAYPSGRLGAPVHKLIVALVFGTVISGGVAGQLFGSVDSCDGGCPGNVFLVHESRTANEVVQVIWQGVGFALTIAVLAILVRRWRHASVAQRRFLRPVYAAAGTVLLVLALGSALAPLHRDMLFSALLIAALISVPLAFLSGLLQMRLARAGIARLLLEVPDEPTPGEAQAAIRRLLADPTLELVLWHDEREVYVGPGGTPVDLATVQRTVTTIGYEGERPFGALLHDPALLAEPEFLEEVTVMLRAALARDRTLRVARASERRYRALLDAVPDVIYRVRRDGFYVDHHASDPRDLAAPPDSIGGRSVAEVLPPAVAERVLEAIARALESGEPQTLEYQLERAGGVRDSETRIVRSGQDEVVIMVRDVTEQRTAQRQSRALLEAIPDNMYRIRRDGTFLEVHANDDRTMPLPAAEMVGKTILEIAPSTLGEFLMQAVEQTLVERTMQTREYQVERVFGNLEIEARAVPSGEDEVVVIVRDITERKAQERRTRALLEAIPDTMYRLRRDGTYLDFHTNDPRDLVAEPERIVGGRLHDLAPQRLVEQLLAGMERTFETGELVTIAYDIERPGKGLRHVETRVLRSGDDEVVGIVQDVTDRKQHELQIERERDFVRSVVRVAPSIFCVVDDDGCLDRFNDATERLTGLRDDDHVRGRRFWEAFLPPDEETLARDALEEVKLTGGTIERECDWLDSRTGERRTVTWALTPITDEHGRARYLLTGLDITERKRQEEARRIERQLVDTIADVTPTFLPVIDADGRFPGRGALNKAFVESLGWSEEEIEGRIFWDECVPPDDAEWVRAAVQSVAAGNAAENYESDWVTRDGRKLLVEWTVVPIRESTTGRAFYLVSGTDVTRRKRQEEELRASRARIVEAGDQERRRLERNLHDGAQQRLVSLSIALRLSVGKLRTEPDVAEDLMRTATEELALALEELRELARGIHPAILSDRGLTPALMGLASRAPLDVELETPEERLPEGVEAAAYYVVSESLANIGKYANATNARVTVRRENGEAFVEVVDDGVGGADASRGTGLLGLHDRVEALGGRLEVWSPPGAGTTVRARIPVAEAALAT